MLLRQPPDHAHSVQLVIKSWKALAMMFMSVRATSNGGKRKRGTAAGVLGSCHIAQRRSLLLVLVVGLTMGWQFWGSSRPGRPGVQGAHTSKHSSFAHGQQGTLQTKRHRYRQLLELAAPRSSLAHVPAPRVSNADPATVERKLSKSQATHKHARGHLRMGMLSTYPPKKCGIGEFAHELFIEICQQEGGPHLGLMVLQTSPAVNNFKDASTVAQGYAPEVEFVLERGQLEDYLRAAQWANAQYDVVILEHDFGLYGGLYGDYIFAFLSALEVPVLCTLHTVLYQAPAPYQKHLEALLQQVSAVSVFMPGLCSDLGVNLQAVPCHYIPHGVPAIPDDQSVRARYKELLQGRQVLITTGLIGPGKGIEHMIEAMPSIVLRFPKSHYIIVGGQHPDLPFDLLGSLRAKVKDSGLEHHVTFIDEYQEKSHLIQWNAVADIVIVPYTDQQQISSGSLSMAMGLGRAVVSTHFRYSDHMCGDDLSSSSGNSTARLPRWPGDVPPCQLVPAGDSRELSRAVIELLQDEKGSRLAALRAASWEQTRSMTWSKVAKRTREVSEDLVRLAPSKATEGLMAEQPQERVSELTRIWMDCPKQRALLDAWRSLRIPRRHAFLVETVVDTLRRKQLALNEKVLPPGQSPARLLQRAEAAILELTHGNLVFRGYLAAPQPVRFQISTDGRFHVDNGLIALHGELSRGNVWHGSLDEGLVFGRGVMYSGMSVSFSVEEDVIDVSLNDNVLRWTHQVQSSSHKRRNREQGYL